MNKLPVTQDEQFAVIEEDLYRWGDWVRRSPVSRGYGDSSFSRLSKAKTKVHSSRKLIHRSQTVTIKYIQGKPAAAHYAEAALAIPVQQIVAVSTRENPWVMKRDDRDDVLGMEIDGYLATLDKIRPRSFRAVQCKFLFHWPREMILDDMRCKETEYKGLIRDAKMHILTCRARADFPGLYRAKKS